MQNTVAKQIKEIRVKNNLSQERFGKKIGVTGKAVSSYENGRSTPPLKVLDTISHVYDASFISIKSEHKIELNNKIKLIEEYLNDVKRILSF